MIDTKEFACPRCEYHGLILVAKDGYLICGRCDKGYNENQAINLKEDKIE